MLAGTGKFYTAKRSSATRRRDRTKRKRLGELGAVAWSPRRREVEIVQTLDILMAQKARSFARMGVANLFAYPGYAEFYRALASDAASRPLAHVSRLDVGATAAAINLGLSIAAAIIICSPAMMTARSRVSGRAWRICTTSCITPSTQGCGLFDFTIGDEALQARLVGYRACALRPYRGRDPARRAGGAAAGRRAAAQAPDQADAAAVEPGEPGARHARRRCGADG